MSEAWNWGPPLHYKRPFQVPKPNFGLIILSSFSLKGSVHCIKMRPHKTEPTLLYTAFLAMQRICLCTVFLCSTVTLEGRGQVLLFLYPYLSTQSGQPPLNAPWAESKNKARNKDLSPVFSWLVCWLKYLLTTVSTLMWLLAKTHLSPRSLKEECPQISFWISRERKRGGENASQFAGGLIGRSPNEKPNPTPCMATQTRNLEVSPDTLHPFLSPIQHICKS